MDKIDSSQKKLKTIEKNFVFFYIRFFIYQFWNFENYNKLKQFQPLIEPKKDIWYKPKNYLLYYILILMK